MILNKNKTTMGEKVFYIINGAFSGVFFIATLYPLIYLVSSSISAPNAVASGKVVLFPVGFSLRGYTLLLDYRNVLMGFWNSFIYAIVGTIMNVFITMITAYALSRKELIGRTFLSFFFAFTMWFSGGLIPTYLLVQSLGLMNTRWALWLPSLLSVWNLIITRTYIQTSIPEEFYEAVSIDGCGYFRYFISIVAPLSGAIISVISLFYAIGHWNTFFNAIIYLSSRDLFPLQIVLRDILIASKFDAELLGDISVTGSRFGETDLLKHSLIIVACLPLWIAYPFVQKYFVKGVMIGAIKG